jgi:hypothetical protein
MLDKLPEDILVIISNQIPFKNVINLKHLNKTLYQKINNISHSIITNELNKYDYKKTKNDMYVCISYVFYDIIQNTKHDKYYINYLKDYYRNYGNAPDFSSEDILISSHNLLKKYITIYLNNYNISLNPYINKIFRKIFKFYLECNTDLYSYPDQLEIFIFYNLYQIDVLLNTKNMKYNITFLTDFLENSAYNLSNSHYKLTLQNYFIHIITNHITIPLDYLSIISKHIVTIKTIKKLFAIKYLDLSNSKFIICCNDDSDFSILKEIIQYKYNLYDNSFLKDNYDIIKDFFNKNAHKYLTMMEDYELSLINSKIIYKHPFRNTHMRLNSRASQHLLYKLRYEMSRTETNKKIYQKLENFISSKQQELYLMRFG